MLESTSIPCSGIVFSIMTQCIKVLAQTPHNRMGLPKEKLTPSKVAHSLMFTTHVSKYFQGEAILIVAYLINGMPSRVLKFQTPCQILTQVYPENRLTSSLPLKVISCSTFVHIPSHQRSKLDPSVIKCLFLGYSPHR